MGYFIPQPMTPDYLQRKVQEILMPGEPEYRTETKFLKEGIPLAPNTVKELTTLGKSLGLSLPGNPESEAGE